MVKSTQQSQSSMYGDVFCRVYNELGWNYYPEAFAQQLMTWIRRQGLQPDSALDLACGTGILSGLLHQQGIRASGVDLSPGMIAVARENHPHIPFYIGDMTTFLPDEPVDLITCTGDSLNHLPQTQMLEDVFGNVARSLNPGGHFIFDLLRESEISESDPFDLDFDAHTRVRFQMLRPDSDAVELKIRVYEDGEFALEQVIREKLYTPELVCHMLQQQGLQVLRCADRLLEDAPNPSTTCYIIARKNS